MPKLIRGYVRIIDRISDWTGWLAASLIFVMVATLLLDAVTRNVLKIPIHWAIELTQFTLAAYYFLGGPFTLKNEEHVRMDLLYASLSERGKAKLDLVTIWCLIFYLGVLLALMVFCLVLMLLQAFSLVFKHIAVLKGEPIE